MANQLFKDFLKCSVELSEGVTVKYEVEVNKIHHNPYYLNKIISSDVEHFEIRISVVWVLEEDGEAHSETYHNTLRFKYSGHEKPTDLVLSNHIRSECSNLLQAMGKTKQEDLRTAITREEIEPIHVHRFSQLSGLEYHTVEAFVTDYSLWVERMYQTYKFMHLLTYGEGSMYAMGWEYPIGSNFIDFLNS